MNIDFNTISISSVLVSCVIILFSSFFKKKGENYATKQDIEVLTRIQEDIKAEINTLSQNKRSLTEQKRKVIIDFYNQFNIIFSKLFIENSFSYITERIPLDKFNQFTENLNPDLNKLMLYLSCIDLFFDEEIDYNENNNIRTLAHTMYFDIYQLNETIDWLISAKVNHFYSIESEISYNSRKNEDFLIDSIHQLKTSISEEINMIRPIVFKKSEKFKKLAQDILFYKSK